MCRAFPFHPIRRCGSKFVVWAFFNTAIRWFLVTLISWRELNSIALRIVAAVAVYCRCCVRNAHHCDTLLARDRLSSCLTNSIVASFRQTTPTIYLQVSAVDVGCWWSWMEGEDRVTTSKAGRNLINPLRSQQVSRLWCMQVWRLC